MDKSLKIGELSKVTGLSRDTLRYYEKEGLIKPSLRNAAGYRLYSKQDLSSINFVITAKKVGFSSDDIAKLLTLKINKKSKSCHDVKEFTQEKINDVDDKIASLLTIKHALGRLHQSCCGGPESARHCSILQALESGNV